MVKEKIMIRVRNTYEKLNEVILGSVDPGVLELADSENRPKLEYVFNQVAEDLDSIQKILEAKNVKVHRPTIFDSAKQFTAPYFSSNGQRIPINPRDHMIVLDDLILETASWNRESYFATTYFKEIFNIAFDKGARWISMPMPAHNIDLVDEMEDDIPNVDPMIDAANMMLHDDVIFMNTQGSNNARGVEWIERHFGDKYKFIKLPFSGHIDCHMCIIRPGTVMTFHTKDEMPDYFKDWNFIRPDTSFDKMMMLEQKLIDGRVQDDDFLNTLLVTNALSLDSNTIMIIDLYKDKELELIKELEKNNVNIVFFPYRCAHFLGNSISCFTLELNRDDA